MAMLTKDEAFAKFLRYGRNSSHFVWFLTKLNFFECSNGWIFSYTQRGRVSLFALEPLIPQTGTDITIDKAEFERAWAEVEAVVQPKIVLFVSIYTPFLDVLKTQGYQALQVGREPYVTVASCIPTGKSGKGVRAARNQALRAGVTVEEWGKDQILSHPTMERDMKKVLEQWKSRNLVDMGQFLNTVDPFQHMEERRYFIATSEKSFIEAFLVATPIPGRNSFFLEDLVIRPGAARGTGELLTLEAMVALDTSKVDMASLGVVSLTSIDESSAYKLPKMAQHILVTIPKYLSKLYNVGGLETFRKRFKPSKWENIHLAVKNNPHSGVGDTRAWFMALGALLASFQPRLNLSFGLIFRSLIRPLAKHPVSITVFCISTLSFVLFNKGGHIPDNILNKYGFSGDAPYWEWPLRTITSDLLFFDLKQYIVSAVLLLFFIRWMEKSYPLKFVAGFVLSICFFDDFVNQLLLMVPYSFIHPKIFASIVSIKDVGPSLWIAMFAGFQLCLLKKHREILFATLSIGLVLTFAFSASHLPNLILNLNHSLFLALGYVCGKMRFEHERSISRSVAKNKPPVAKCVASAKIEKTAA